MRNDRREILRKRLGKLQRHYAALDEYHGLITELEKRKDLYDPEVFQTLKGYERAVLDAYLKRHSSLQDYLGAKVFPLLLESAGIPTDRMSQVLAMVEREGIIESLQDWIELREIRNDLEHDYPGDLRAALSALKTCVSGFAKLEKYYRNTIGFLRGNGDPTL
uniref:Nucleotidyltransferase substrate binding protein, HI0074 family n=2 Tax=Candidatus Kentrum sp. SD TaxID=2126332 RepID=A0A450YPJ3_9GAMM|nr:MAG: hypothetical protein BECKSD772F_GA0070984_11474 [Candidatus Kentron sp. SD]VFK45062.1 MAG: hypothetical protein BECKSD772E_GA0070983_104718 [Candidatus Kentron sp. SD]